MPQRIGRPFWSQHQERHIIPCQIDGKTANFVGIHQGREEVAFFISAPQENIFPGKKTRGGWRYYPIPREAQSVVFDVSWDKHPAVRSRKTSIREFRDAENQIIPISHP